MLCHALVHTYQRQDKKTNKKQLKNLGKGNYVMSVELFEGFVGSAHDLTMNDNEYFKLTERSKM